MKLSHISQALNLENYLLPLECTLCTLLYIDIYCTTVNKKKKNKLSTINKYTNTVIISIWYQSRNFESCIIIYPSTLINTSNLLQGALYQSVQSYNLQQGDQY
jgi:hypothetical protein